MTSPASTRVTARVRSLLARALALTTATLLFSAACTPAAQAAAPEVVAQWDFATAPAVADTSTAANVFTATGGSDGGAQLRPVTTDPLTGYTYDEAERSVRYQGWNDGAGTKSWTVELSTRGFTDVTLSSQQRSSGSGPRDFAVQVSTDGRKTWQDVPGGELTLSSDFATGTTSSLALPAEASDKESVAIRWVVTSTTSVSGEEVGATGSSRIKGVTVSGIPTGAPVERPTTVTALAPTEGSSSAAPDASISATFNKAVTVAEGAKPVLVDENGAAVGGLGLVASGSTVSVTHAALEHDRTYTVTIPRSAVRGASDQVSPAADVTWSFRTAPAPRDAVAEWAFADGDDAGVFWATGGAYAEHSALTSVGTNGDYEVHPDRGDAASVQGWADGARTKYWLAALSTAGFENLALSAELSGSGSGPRDFVVEMRTDRKTWTEVPDSRVTASTHTFDCPEGACALRDLALPADASDAKTLYLRWIMTSDTPTNTAENDTVGGYGDSFIRGIRVVGDRIDGTPTAMPVFDVLTSPADGAATIARDVPVSVRFNQDVEIADADGIRIVDETGAAAPGVKASAKGDTLTIAHDDLDFGHRYTATIASSAVVGVDGEALVRDVSWTFSTVVKTPGTFSMNINGDPRTTMGFAWYTPPQISDTKVQLAPAADRDGEGFPEEGRIEFTGTSEVIDTFITAADREANRTTKFSSHRVTATGLKPGTAYVYRVGDGTANGWGRIGTFTTDAPKNEPFHFIFSADSQASDLPGFLAWQDTLEKAVDTVEDPKFILVNGDLVDNGDLEEQWQWMLDSAAEQLADLPYVPVLGGHEVEDSGTLPNNNFYNHFNTPKDTGTGAHDGSVYSFEYGDALFMQFNSQYGGFLDESGEVARMDAEFANQLDWLRRTVAETDARWKFVSLHKGVYSAGENVCNWEADRVAFYEKVLVPVFQETGVDVVFEAHDHMYMRSHQMRDGKPVDTITDENGEIVVQYDVTDPNGILYLMPNALGNKFYETPEGCDTSFAAINEQPEKKMFVDFSVTQDTLSFKAYTAAEEDEAEGDDGVRLFDRYSITRTDGTPDPVRDAAVTVSDGQAAFAWKAPAASKEPVRGYRIYEKDDRAGTNWSSYIPAEAGKTDYAFTLPVSDDPTVRYEFVIRAVGAKDNSAPVAVVPPASSDDTTAPSVPAGLSVRVPSQFQVDLAWLPSVDAAGVAGYRVFRDGEPIARTTTTTFSDAGRDPGATHEYAVSAYDAAGNESERSAVREASLPTNPTTSEPQRPFGQHTAYTPGTLKPGVPQEEMDAVVAGLYDAWKKTYLTQNPYEPDQYYVYYNGHGEAGEETPDAVTTSESNGYGMLITAIMAGHDPDAKKYFDSLHRFAKAHPSSMDPNLMAWQQRDDGTAIVNTLTFDPEHPDWGWFGDDAATDGDLDMAYALLMADAQWGSGGEFDYLGDARRIIDAILNSAVHPSENVVLLGDWTKDEAVYGRGTRTSDFMIQHFKDFATVTGAERWTTVTDKMQAVSRQLFQDFSPTTGLLPDFAFQEGDRYRPADPEFLESEFDGAYNWNASRVPWRLGTDHLLTGDDRTQEQLATMSAWIASATGGDPLAIDQGYQLDGSTIEDGFDLAFAAPFTVAAMHEGGDQAWLDKLWKANTAEPVTTYFGDSIRMLSMIVASGNWWSPAGVGLPPTEAPPAPPADVTATAVGTDAVDLAWRADGGPIAAAAAGDATVIGYRVYRDGVAVASVADGTTYRDTGLTAGTEYSYHVTAIDDQGRESSPSETVSVRTGSAGGGSSTPPPSPGGDGLATTGGDAPVGLIVGGVLLVAAGALSLFLRRRRAQDPTAHERRR